jgi:hypothetical protein
MREKIGILVFGIVVGLFVTVLLTKIQVLDPFILSNRLDQTICL